jgi:hypothetical protein
VSAAKAKRPGAGVEASPGSASPDQRQRATMRSPWAAYFENLKARLDADSERQLDEMDKYQNRRVI